MAAAYAALASLMHTIHQIQLHHAPPIFLDEKQTQSLTQNITFLQGFLESYVPPVSDDDDESADPLEMRIADVAYAAEDVIESHIVDAIQLRNVFNVTRLFINFYKNLQRVIEEMDLIINKMAITSIDTAEKAVVPASSVVASSSTGPSSSTAVVVGFEDASLKIMEKLTEDRPDRQVIPIVGMGGIGKTTLARYVYAQKLTKECFDILAWVTISQQHNTREILCDLFSQVTGKDKKQVSEAQLGSELHKCLFGRKFLIVMDDMWSIDAWDNIQHLFPKNQNGSRILVTTRLLELSSRLNKDYSHQVGFLDEASSWDLFSKTVFGEKTKTSCPGELKKIANKIVDGCRGLPLSIVVVGGLLKKVDATERCWESIGSNLTSVVNLENNKHCLRLLRLSYNHLPVHVKPCFLYMGVFMEDAEIRVSTLVDLWISEGFIKSLNGESLETSAMRLLKDLVDRNLVLVSKLGSTGNIKWCKIHDLLRDLCMKEGQKEGFYHIIGQRSPRGIDRQRRIVVPMKAVREGKVLGDLRSMPLARSVICEYEFEEVLKCSNLRLLRTFHADAMFPLWGDSKFTHSIDFKYVNLRHLTINIDDENNMSSLLSSVSLLWNLHTIIVYNGRLVNRLPDEIWKMPQLRHIKIYNHFSLPDPPTVDDDAVIMENLRTLSGVMNFKCCQEVVKRIPNIKELKTQYTDVDKNCFISNIKLLCKLESLSVTCYCGGGLYLHNLSFPHSLKRLSLTFDRSFEWEESMLEKMGSLPFLEKLILVDGLFGTEMWEIGEGQFPRLKYLRLDSWCDLEHWTTAEEGSFIFPCLEQIELHLLEKLNSIPREIGNIATLQKIEIAYCNEAAVKSAKEMVEEQMELQGDQLPFRVVVRLLDKELLQSLSGPNFEVFFLGSQL